MRSSRLFRRDGARPARRRHRSTQPDQSHCSLLRDNKSCGGRALSSITVRPQPDGLAGWVVGLEPANPAAGYLIGFA